jgi:hypothetical protein
MTKTSLDKHSLLAVVLVLAALPLLWAIYAAPIWWVSLTAPNYPPESFPDGVRIHFHMNGVFNGCQKIEKTEIQEDEALDCVHEMDTINHYVGMYPIAAGGVIERAFSPFLMSMLGVMLIGFAVPGAKTRMAVMALGFAGIFAWMYLYYFGDGGLKYQNEGYLSALVTSMDQGGGDEEAAGSRVMSTGEALIARLKAEMAEAEGRSPAAAVERKAASEKERLIANLRETFERSEERRPVAGREAWDGSGAQMLGWHYEKSLGRYFNNPAEIVPMAGKMTIAAEVVFWALPLAMALLVWGARKNSGILYWMLVLVPIALPVFFIIDYSAWLWWYGHSLNEMGAFTVKPFMPTVFGDGKVAQFTTHSYPYTGFGLMVAMSAVLAVAAVIRRREAD